jgi:hypothetical protein
MWGTGRRQRKVMLFGYVFVAEAVKISLARVIHVSLEHSIKMIPYISHPYSAAVFSIK